MEKSEILNVELEFGFYSERNFFFYETNTKKQKQIQIFFHFFFPHMDKANIYKYY